MLVLGVVALLAAVRTFVRLPEQVNLVTVPTAAAIVLAVLGALAAGGGLTGRQSLATFAGAGFLAAGLAWLVVTPFRENWLGADGSTLALFGGLGMGLLVIGVTHLTCAVPTREEQ